MHLRMRASVCDCVYASESLACLHVCRYDLNFLVSPSLSLSGAISITQDPTHTHTHIHYTPHYMLTIAIILCMIRSDAPTCTRAGIHLWRPLEPHVFCVAVGHLPSLFISLHLNETLRDTMVLLQVNKVFKPSPHTDARAGGSRVVVEFS